MIFPTSLNTNVSYFEKISGCFFDLGKLSHFDAFLTVKKSSKHDNLPKSKMHPDFFFTIWDIWYPQYDERKLNKDSKDRDGTYAG